MNLSIVSTLYCSQATLCEFIQRAQQAAQEFGGEYEIILVNDGSPDRSLDLAIEMTVASDDIVVIDLSRNFGHHRAMLAGMKESRGEFVFLIDSDLEEDPAWLSPLHETLLETGADMASGVQLKRRGGMFERATGEVFYRLFEHFMSLKTPRNPVTARVMTRRFVEALDAYEERAMFLSGLFAYTGFKQVTLPVTKTSKGSSTYSLRRRGSLAVDAVTSFSGAPLRYTFYLGLIIFGLTSIASLGVTVTWAIFDRAPSGWTSLIISVWMLGGLILSAIGVVGIYIWRIFDEVKSRPAVIIREIYGRTYD